jgi:hypothetical protein
MGRVRGVFFDIFLVEVEAIGVATIDFFAVDFFAIVFVGGGVVFFAGTRLFLFDEVEGDGEVVSSTSFFFAAGVF